jgi:hypothetical protein
MWKSTFYTKLNLKNTDDNNNNNNFFYNPESKTQYKSGICKKVLFTLN